MLKWIVGLILLGGALCVLKGNAEDAAARNWTETARQTHARFKGRAGTFAQFGDSITVTHAFWGPLREERRNVPRATEAAFQAVKAALPPECWSDWKGPEFGCEGGKTIAWADEHLDGWLKKLNPETAVLMFGSNDLHQLTLDEYRTRLRAVLRRCADNGTVVILTTPPPQHGFEKQAAQFAQAMRDAATELKLPLIDYHAEILSRRPDDWDGALERFKGIDTYEVPTLLSGDGVHPSFPQRFRNDYSEEALRSSGYTLRNHLTVQKLAEVLAVLRATPAPEQAAVKGPPSQPWFPKAPPLPAPTGEVIRVTDMPQLYAAAANVKPGGTILLAPGRSVLGTPLELRTDRITMRGEGDRNAAVIDGSGNAPGAPGEAVRLTACEGVTIADLTVENVRWNGIKINSETGVQNLRIYNCVLHNIWQRHIKGVKVPVANRERMRPRNCRIEYCLLYNDRPKQFSDDGADTAQNFNGNYIGGIDAMEPHGWLIRNNVFVGLQGRTREARGAVFLWQNARECVVERNVMIDCDSGICIGNGQTPEPGEIHATGFIVRNNFITRAPENGILADYTRDCRILHNTIYDSEKHLGRGIRVVHNNDGLVVANNLLAGPAIRKESDSRMEFLANVEGATAGVFADAAAGNLRLAKPAAGITDAAERRPEAPEDIDGKPRGARADLGAHELAPG